MLVSALVEQTAISRVQEDPVTALPADRAAHHVDRADDLPALAPQFLHRHQRVQRLAGLADRHVQRVGVDDRIAVPELRRGLRVGRDAGQFLGQHRAHLPGVVGRAAAEELHLPDRPELARVQVDAAQLGRCEPLVETAAQRPAQGLRLLVDLLAHVVLERAELVVPGLGLHRGRLLGLPLSRPAPVPLVERGGAEVGSVHRGHFGVVQVHDLLGVTDQRGHVGGDEHLRLPDTEHDGAAIARHHQLVRVLGVQHDQAVGAFHVAQGLANGFLEAGAFGGLGGNHVGERLGVGLADQLDTAGDQRVPELLGVLDDAVVHHGDPALGIGVRMGVDLVRLTVRGPPGVADADRGLRTRGSAARPVLNPVPEILDAACRLGHLQAVAVDDGQPGRVVAPVLEAPESLE
jgi:hypothetical protein